MEFVMLALFASTFWLLSEPIGGSSKRGEWWVEVDTDSPKRTYFFGPYDSREEASNQTTSYIRNLEKKGAQKISINIKQGRQPTELRASEDS